MSKAGVVDFTYPLLGVGPVPRSCTGTMIAPNVILTAGRCFTVLVRLGIRQGSFPFNVHYYDPDQGRRLVHSGTGTWMVHPSFNPQFNLGPGTSNADVAVIKVSLPFGSHTTGGTDYHDYMRIYADGEQTLEDKLIAYGAGLYSYSGSSDDQLRYFDFPVRSAAPEHIVLGGDETHGMCWGDTGGPVIADVVVGGEVVSTVGGVWSQYDINPNIIIGSGETPLCQSGDGQHSDSAACRMRAAITDWVAGAAGLSCAPQSGGNRAYRRCFDLPFIEDVPGEGLDAGVATGIVVASLW